MRTIMMDNTVAILWLRRDLRISDNPAMSEAFNANQSVIPVYIHDDGAKNAPIGAAAWWLHGSLSALSKTLSALGQPLILRRGDERETLHNLIEEIGASAVYWNRRYDPNSIEIDRILKSELSERGLDVRTYNATLTREPWEVKTGSDSHYRVFTPFWRTVRKIGPARTEQPPLTKKNIRLPLTNIATDALNDWTLLPTKPNWASEFPKHWTPGEAGAHDRLMEFLDNGINLYKDKRDHPDIDATSRLSAHLAFGEISPITIWNRTEAARAHGKISDDDADKFLAEVGWRDFSYNLLYHYPDLPQTPLKSEFKNYPWQDDPQKIALWQRGQTGYPIVDAGMRQLWRTGWMHNRIRMVAASFLVKDICANWTHGREWFHETLVDHDAASNAASWQWVAGCGADAAPFFRIFNPVTQSEKFDKDGAYIRRFVPELADMPAKYIHAPWRAPDDVLAAAGVELGKTYPEPMLNHKNARDFALDAYKKIRAA